MRNSLSIILMALVTSLLVGDRVKTDSRVAVQTWPSEILRGDHEKDVEGVAFSRDGRLLASGCRDGTVKLWDAITGEEKLTLTGHQDSVHGVAFAPGSHLLASASFDSTIKVWEIPSGRLIHTLTGHTSDVNAVAFSPNGFWLASVSDDKTVRLWKVGK